MEQLQLAVTAFGTIGIMACLIALFWFMNWKRRHPNAGTPYATPAEKQKIGRFITLFLGGFLIYALLFAGALAYMATQNPPWALLAMVILTVLYIFAGSRTMRK